MAGVSVPQLVSLAKTYLGTPYVWGGASPKTGFDCSGFVQWVYSRQGINLPRVTYDQVNAGVPVPRQSLQAGDIVFLEPTAKGPAHEALYIGGGKVIAAPHTGADVQVQDLNTIANQDGYVTARRVIPTGAPSLHQVASAAPADVPPQLASAIQKAASKYGVDPSVLAGIWKIESGSTYPNPAVNKEGYGGLFGTTNWNASTQSQANLAAQILSTQIKQQGSLPAALLKYSGGGYSSVPGATMPTGAPTPPPGAPPAAAVAPPAAAPRAPVAPPPAPPPTAPAGDHTDTTDLALQLLTRQQPAPFQPTQAPIGSTNIPAVHIEAPNAGTSPPVVQAIRLAQLHAQDSAGPSTTASFAKWLHNADGLLLPGSLHGQLTAGTEQTSPTPLPRDLLFFGNGAPTHQGISTGGHTFLHFSHGGRTIHISSLANPHYGNSLRSVRSLFG